MTSVSPSSGVPGPAASERVAAGDPFAGLAREVGETEGVTPTLELLADAAVRLIPCDWSAVLVADRLTDKPAKLSVTTDPDLLAVVADIAGKVARSPGIDAYSSGVVAHADDLEHEPTWPQYAAEMVRRTPVRSVVSVPLVLHGDRVGVITAYGRTAGCFDADAVHRAQILADHAGVAVGKAISEDHAGNLTVALERNREIGVAIGVLVERNRMTPADAFAALRRISQHHNRRLADVAADLVRTGVLPDVPPPRANEHSYRG